MKRILSIISTFALAAGYFSFQQVAFAGDENSAGSKVEQTQADDTKDSKSKAIIEFKDGKKVFAKDIEDKLNSDKFQSIASRMSYGTLKIFVALSDIPQNELVKLTKNIRNSEKFKANIQKACKTFLATKLENKLEDEAMTFEALKKNYDENYDKFVNSNVEKGKEPQEFDLLMLSTADKTIANKLKSIKTPQELESFLKSSGAIKNPQGPVPTRLSYTEAFKKHQAMFPAELVKAIVKGGKNSIVGPYKLSTSYLFLFVKDMRKAEKPEFTQQVADSYKNIVRQDFKEKVVDGLYKKYDAKLFDVSGKEVDHNSILKEEDKNKSKKKKLDYSKVKPDVVLAKLKLDGKEKKITAKDVLGYFGVDSFMSEQFASLAQGFNLSFDKVIMYSIKIVLESEMLDAEVKAKGFDKLQENLDEIERLKGMSAAREYFEQNIKISKDEVKKSFKEFLDSIPAEEKNDHEVSTKMVFFKTQEDAISALKDIRSGKQKFNALFDSKKDQGALDLGYVKRRGTTPEIWDLLKKSSAGTCTDKVIELSGSNFGFDGLNYAIVYVADRRPVTLPTLADPSVEKQFKMLAKREKISKFVSDLIIKQVKFVEGRSIEEFAEKKDFQNLVNLIVNFLGLM